MHVSGLGPQLPLPPQGGHAPLRDEAPAIVDVFHAHRADAPAAETRQAAAETRETLAPPARLRESLPASTEVGGFQIAGARPPAPTRIYPGYPRQYVDSTTRPETDFYQYAVGGYEATHPIPSHRASYGFRTEMYERVQRQLLSILEDAAKASPPPGSVQQKIGDFYASGMDQEGIEKAGLAPLRPVLDRLEAVRDRQGVEAAVASMHRDGLPALFRFGAGSDLHDPSMMTGDASQGGLGLPDREYYLKTDAASVELRTAYRDHVARMLELGGDAPETARAGADAVLALETRLAQAQMPRVEMRDAKNLDHPMSRADLAALTPGFSWAGYFGGLGRGDLETINVSTPAFFQEVDRALDEVPVADWKTYLRWSTLNTAAPSLGKAFEQADFDFYSRRLNGVEQPQPRWQQMVQLTDSYLGEAVGQEYVHRHFPPEAKERARQMVQDVVDVLRERISSVPWMGEETRKEALAKVDRLGVKIGYPDQWKDYSPVEVERGPLLENVLSMRRFGASEDFASIGKPVDRGRWAMTPATVNAYFDPSLNEIVFPAARLQPPFFDVNADDAANYGATGVTIGHELTHGFDDSGADFDSSGRLRNWWSPEDRERFDRLAQRVTEQMNGFEFAGVQQNGKLVTGEALADQGGLELAFDALQRALAREPVASADGFTPQQRFFLSYAVARQAAVRPEAAKEQMQSDPHPLGPFRVNGPLANMPAFHEAFDVRPGDPMYRAPQDRNKVWDA